MRALSVYFKHEAYLLKDNNRHEHCRNMKIFNEIMTNLLPSPRREFKFILKRVVNNHCTKISYKLENHI